MLFLQKTIYVTQDYSFKTMHPMLKFESNMIKLYLQNVFLIIKYTQGYIIVVRIIFLSPPTLFKIIFFLGEGGGLKEMSSVMLIRTI